MTIRLEGGGPLSGTLYLEPLLAWLSCGDVTGNHHVYLNTNRFNRKGEIVFRFDRTLNRVAFDEFKALRAAELPPE